MTRIGVCGRCLEQPIEGFDSATIGQGQVDNHRVDRFLVLGASIEPLETRGAIFHHVMRSDASSDPEQRFLHGFGAGEIICTSSTVLGIGWCRPNMAGTQPIRPRTLPTRLCVSERRVSPLAGRALRSGRRCAWAR